MAAVEVRSIPGAIYRNRKICYGLHFLHDERAYDKIEGYINNNGVVECFFPLINYLHLDDKKYDGYFERDHIWKKLMS